MTETPGETSKDGAQLLLLADLPIRARTLLETIKRIAPAGQLVLQFDVSETFGPKWTVLMPKVKNFKLAAPTIEALIKERILVEMPKSDMRRFVTVSAKGLKLMRDGAVPRSESAIPVMTFDPSKMRSQR